MKVFFISLSILGALLISISIVTSADNPPAAATKGAAPTGNATAGGNAVADARAADEEAIRASGKEFIDAYNARDAKKIAALWTPEAVYIDPATGEQSVGRDAIEKDFNDAFSDNKDAKLTVDSVTIEFVSPGVAIVRGTAHVTQPG